ncbi:MAG: response regulator [Pseudomonadota bacterium]
MDHKIKVLMVDDEEQFRTTTKKILNRRGFETILAGSGKEAIEKLGENPDVVILDIKMPGMDGHQALKEILKISPDLPVIFLTGHGDISSAKGALAEGAFDYLSKPCDIEVMAAKINEAFRHGKHVGTFDEKTVMDVMIPVEEYTTLTEDQTIREAIERLKESFLSKVSTSRLMETGHRSILVLDPKGRAEGFLAITDLIEAIMPSYLNAPKPSMADSIQYSPMFWKGMFTREIGQMAQRKIGEIMSPEPMTIEGDSNLMEAAYVMFTKKARRLVVVRSGEVVGVIREQDLFFEMARVLAE